MKILSFNSICLLVIIQLSVIALSGCSSDDPETELIKEELAGTWIGEATETFENIKIATVSTLTFKSNSTLECEHIFTVTGDFWWGNQLGEPTVYEDLKYSIKSNIMSIKGKYIGEDKSQEYIYKINLSGDVLKLTYVSGVMIWGSGTITINGTKYNFAPEEITYHRQ